MTLIFNFLRAMVMTYIRMQKFKVNGQSVPKIEWKQTDGQTDGQTEASALPPTVMRSVTNMHVNKFSFSVNYELAVKCVKWHCQFHTSIALTRGRTDRVLTFDLGPSHVFSVRTSMHLKRSR